MKLNSQNPDKKFTIRVKNSFDNYFLINKKVYENNHGDYYVKYNRKFHKLALTSYSYFIGTIEIKDTKYKLDLTNIDNIKKTININSMLQWSIQLNCAHSVKKILSEYSKEQVDNIDFSFLFASLIKSKRVKRIFDLIKPLINFDKIEIDTALSGIYWGADRSKYNRDVLLFIFDNIKNKETFKGTVRYLELNDFLKARENDIVQAVLNQSNNKGA